MNAYIDVIGYAVGSVVPIFIIGAAGAFLIKFNAVTQEQLRVLGKIVYYLMLPALLATKVALSVNFSQLTYFWIFPLCGVLFVVIGICLGLFFAKWLCADRKLQSITAAAIAFPNASYLPIPLVLSVIATFPCFRDYPHAAELAVAYISIYLIGYTPLLWSAGQAMVTGRNLNEVRISHVITPPIIGIALGIIIGLVPWLNNTIVSEGAILSPIFSAAKLIAEGTIPCALLIIGGNFIGSMANKKVSSKIIIGVICARLIIFPLAVILFFFILKQCGWFAPELVFILTIAIIAASPPANNLAVMASVLNHQVENAVAALLFWTYLAAVVTLPVVITITIKLFS
jgi:predicted permease